MPAKFKTGQVLITPGAKDATNSLAILSILGRHVRGDWGDVSEDDKKANEDALVDGGRILSAYMVGEVKVWVITEAKDDDGKRVATTILLPDEY